jgi:hypothetical protein
MSRVFIDFGRNRVYALPEDGEEVMVFNDFLEMFGKLSVLNCDKVGYDTRGSYILLRGWCKTDYKAEG